MMNGQLLACLKQIAGGIAQQFGPSCEVVVHDLSDVEHSIVAIENGHVSGRKVGDGPSMAVLDALSGHPEKLHTEGSYLTKGKNGRVLKSTTVYLRDTNGKIIALFCMNFDITELSLAGSALAPLISVMSPKGEDRSIPQNVAELLDDLLEDSVRLVGKPVPLMTREDKMRAVQFLNERGALLITKSGDKISKFLGISKYTLYSYIGGASDEPSV